MDYVEVLAGLSSFFTGWQLVAALLVVSVTLTVLVPLGRVLKNLNGLFRKPKTPQKSLREEVIQLIDTLIDLLKERNVAGEGTAYHLRRLADHICGEEESKNT